MGVQTWGPTRWWSALLAQLLAEGAPRPVVEDVPSRSAEEVGSITDSQMLAVVLEVEEEQRDAEAMAVEDHAGRRLRDWQVWKETEQALPEVPALEVRLRARVRHRGLAGQAQALTFRVGAGDTVDVALAVTRGCGGPRVAETTSLSTEREAQRP